MKCRRGISEILSAVIIIAVVVSGLGLYVGLSQQRILGDTTSVLDAIVKSKEQHQEIIDTVAMFRNDIQPDVLEIYVFNSGLKNVTISNIFVNGTIDMEKDIRPVSVKDLNENPIWPDDKTIPMGSTAKIILDFSGITSVTTGIENLVIITTSNKFIEIVNDTS